MKQIGRSKPKRVYLYLFVTLFFSVWMLFIDMNSWLMHRELNEEIDALETKKIALKNMIAKDSTLIEYLRKEDNLIFYAREHLGYKRADETVFIIKDQTK